MIEGHIIFNAILYSIVIAYILYINFSAYYQTGTGFLKALVNLFQNWIFRTVYLLIVGFFALDLFPYGGFVLAILLTIAFLNTNMLVYKKDVEESLANKDEKNAKLPPFNATIQSTTTGGFIPPPSSVGVKYPIPANIQQMGQPTNTTGLPQTGASTPTYPPPQTGAPTTTPQYNFQ